MDKDDIMNYQIQTLHESVQIVEQYPITFVIIIVLLLLVLLKK